MKLCNMTKNELEMLLEEGEGYKLEFKRAVNSDLAKEMVAFANASGGRIIIGIDDANRVVGTDLSNHTLSQIEDVAMACDPFVPIRIEKCSHEKLVIVHVPEGGNKPYRCAKGFYLRNGANSQKMGTAEITAFIQAEGKVRFDEQLRQDLPLKKSLDEKRLNHFLDLAGITHRKDVTTLLLNLGAGEIKNKTFCFNQAGVLFFSREPNLRLFHVSVICALYKGIGKAVILDRKELAGSIIENVEDALLFLKKHLNLRQEITSLQRREVWEIPEVALREGVVNAICHRDYFEKGAQVMIEVFDDRVEISNPGGLPKGLSEKEFGKRSVCRNPLIASLLLRSGYIEKMGTGIDRIRTALTKAKCPQVSISFKGFFTLSFPRPQPKASPIPENMSGDLSVEMSGEMSGEITDLVLKILCNNSKITISEIARRIQKPLRTVERTMNRLRQTGQIQRIGSKKAGGWEVIEAPKIIQDK
ncbi:MAG: putative DNA binding domain-containing protein [Candidatus Riflebacteria bacterium]|nr:putative DNA binding domain-containing protein [Candidatus Riflebacteria bacterium]